MANVITSETFDSFVKNPDKVVLVDFWATWCGPCRMLAPVVEDIANDYADRLTVGKVDVDECPDLAQRFGIMSIPTLLLFRNGELAAKKVGYMPKADLAAAIDAVL